MAFDKPQSRNEAILQNMLGANNELEPPKSRVEALLQDIAGQMPEANPSEGTTTGTLERLKIGDDIYTVEGGGSGTSDYDALNNKPQIAGVTLSGDKSLADLGIASATTVSGILDGTDIDSFGDVETALGDKVDKVNGKGLSTNDYDDTEKAAVAAATTAIAGIKDGTTIDSFGDVETALGAIQDGQSIDSFADVESAIGAIEDGTTIDSFADVESALADKQDATDSNLQTTADTIVGAINEHEGDIGQLKSGLTNVADDVKLNTQDLTTPSRTKNLLEIQSESQTVAGITYTVNDDGTITANGTATGTSIFAFYTSKQSDLGKSYIFSGCHNGSSSTYKLQIFSDSQGVLADDIGSGATFNPSTTFAVRIVAYSGVTLSNVVFDPMLRLATETDSTFVPYIPSVESRIEAVKSGLTNLSDKIKHVFVGGYIAGLALNSGNIGFSVPITGLYTAIVSATQTCTGTIYGSIGAVGSVTFTMASKTLTNGILSFSLTPSVTLSNYTDNAKVLMCEIDKIEFTLS